MVRTRSGKASTEAENKEAPVKQVSNYLYFASTSKIQTKVYKLGQEIDEITTKSKAIQYRMVLSIIN